MTPIEKPALPPLDDFLPAEKRWTTANFAKCATEYATAYADTCMAPLLARIEDLTRQNESQKDEWLSWDAKRKGLERDAARYRLLRAHVCQPVASITMGIWGVDGNEHAGYSPKKPETVDAAIDAALSATKDPS